MSKYEAMHRILVHKAVKGDSKAFETIVDIVKDDPTALEPPPMLQIVFTDQTPEERQEFNAWRAAKKKKDDC
jgi:hypothetical protein